MAARRGDILIVYTKLRQTCTSMAVLGDHGEFFLTDKRRAYATLRLTALAAMARGEIGGVTGFVYGVVYADDTY